MLHLRKERALQLTDREGTRGRPVRTRGTKDSLMSEVTMVLFPTPSGRVPGHGHWLVVRGPRGGRPTHHRRREGSVDSFKLEKRLGEGRSRAFLSE